ncbi:MAG TPA: restriction endonuclease, partial [Victivallales bacterium]|nr:restriction endonuclease [Victivallales bacterium]
MVDYDFRILQYNEFENLTRDLLQAEFDIYIESFKDGKDSGIDFRFGTVKGGRAIVQVKRYKDWKELKPQLEKEVSKVTRLNPERYILSTSAGLSPDNKATIMH